LEEVDGNQDIDKVQQSLLSVIQTRGTS